MRGRRLACFSWAYVRTQVSRVLNELRALTSTPVREPSTVKGQEPSSLSPHQLAAQLRRLAHELEATPAVKRDQDKVRPYRTSPSARTCFSCWAQQLPSVLGVQRARDQTTKSLRVLHVNATCALVVSC